MPGGVPGSKPLIISGGTQIASANLDENETAIFERDLKRIARMLTLEGSLERILLDDTTQYYQGAQMAKGSVGSNPTFAGINAKGTELGFQLIRSTTILSLGSSNVYKWVQTYGASGWANVFGSSAAPVSLATTGVGGASATNLNGRVLLCFGAMLDPVPTPQIAEYRFHIGSVDYEVEPIAWIPASDLAYCSLMGVFVVPVNGSFYMRGNIQPSSTGGQDAMELIGLAFATGDYLSTE